MDSLYTDLSQLSPSTVDPCLRVIICRKWQTLGSDMLPESLHAVLMDQRGCRIQASVQKKDISLFSPKLVEGRLFNIRNFHVLNKTKSTSVRNHGFVILFQVGTFVAESSFHSFPPSRFSFEKYSDVKSPSKFSVGHLFDVIGQVVDVEVLNHGKPSFKFMLQNSSSELLQCQVFEPHRSKIYDFVKMLRENISVPIVIILQLCRKTIIQGSVCVATKSDISDVIFDQNVPEIVEYKSRNPVSKNVGFCDGSKFPVPCVTSSKKELRHPRTMVYDLFDLEYVNDVMDIWTIGTITSINEELGWYYTSCSDCSIIGDVSSSALVCPSCGDPILHKSNFKIHVTIEDIGGGSAKIILMNELARSLIQASVFSLMKVHFKGNLDRGFPAQVYQSLIGRELLVKVKVEDHHFDTTKAREYCVVKCCDDTELLEKHKELMERGYSEGTFEVSCVISSDDDDSSSDSSDSSSEDSESSTE